MKCRAYESSSGVTLLPVTLLLSSSSSEGNWSPSEMYFHGCFDSSNSHSLSWKGKQSSLHSIFLTFELIFLLDRERPLGHNTMSVPCQEASGSSVTREAGAGGSWCPSLWASLGQVFPWKCLLCNLPYSAPIRNEAGEEECLASTCRAHKAGCTKQDSGRGFKAKCQGVQGALENHGNQWPVQNWTFITTRKREQKEEHQKPLKRRGQNFRTPPWPPGQPWDLGCWMACYYLEASSAARRQEILPGQPQALDGSFAFSFLQGSV